MVVITFDDVVVVVSGWRVGGVGGGVGMGVWVEVG